MPPRLRITGGGEQYLPLAKNMLRKLKLTGLAHTRNEAAIDDVTIRVTIADGHEYINISGGGTAEYLVRQTNDANKQSVQLSAAKISKGSIKVTDTEADAGRHDWVSKNGKDVVTFDNGATLRYEVGQLGTISHGEEFIFVNGKKFLVGYGVKGACILRGTVNEVDYKYTVFATYGIFTHFGNLLGATKIFLFYIDPAADKFDDGTSPCVLFAEYEVPDVLGAGTNAGQLISQPTFFSGDGLKLISVLCTIVATDEGFDYGYNYTRPFYIVRGTLSLDSAGLPVATFATTEHPTSNTSTEVGTLTPPGSPTGIVDNDTRNLVRTRNTVVSKGTTTVGGFPGLSLGDTSDDMYELHSTVVKSLSRTHSVIGADLTSAGEEKIVMRLDQFASSNTDDAVVTVHADIDVAWSLNDDGALVSALSGLRTTNELVQRTETSGFYSEIAVNGATLLVVHRNGLDGYSFTFTNTILRDANGHVTSTSPNTTVVPGTFGQRFMCLRDIDARHGVVAAVISQFPTSGPISYSAKMIFKIAGTTEEKVIFTGVVPDLPTGLDEPRYVYNTFASRRAGEYLACFSAVTSSHEGNVPSNVFELLNFLGNYGVVDHEPITKYMSASGAIAEPLKNFSLSSGAVFRFDPVRLIGK